MTHRRAGFTLIELLVVIAIIAILAAILFPVFARAKQTAQRSGCASNLKQLTLAIVAYTDDNGQRFPKTSWMSWMFADGYGYAAEKKGPFIMDCLGKYTKNAGVWMCPAVKPWQRLPKVDLNSIDWTRYTWMDNGGMAGGRYFHVGSNYCWNHLAHGTDGAWFVVAGSLVSQMVRPTRAMMFIEMPYWTNNCPHGSGPDKGVNMVFYDGHVMFLRRTTYFDAYYEWSWKGWYNK